MSQEKPLNATLLRFEHGHDFMYRRALKRRAEGQLISALDPVSPGAEASAGQPGISDGSGRDILRDGLL